MTKHVEIISRENQKKLRIKLQEYQEKPVYLKEGFFKVI